METENFFFLGEGHCDVLKEYLNHAENPRDCVNLDYPGSGTPAKRKEEGGVFFFVFLLLACSCVC
jgi:hypothetical protein